MRHLPENGCFPTPDFDVLIDAHKMRGLVEITGAKKEAEASIFTDLQASVEISIWSWKRDSHQASDPLKSKGFL